MPRDEIVRALVDGEMLSGWSEPDARHLAQAMMWQEVRDGAMIVEQGAARGRDTRGAYLIVSGAVDVLTKPVPVEALHRLRPLVGQTQSLQQQRYAARGEGGADRQRRTQLQVGTYSTT